ncbi:MAG: pyrroline-5-carboxylate reductase [Elusimicrobiaceae bacterium]|nr:pyrroline-5-carboxylate reductase [Elusimicrobiaceae bacterium]
MKLGFIGAGEMGGAIIRGLLASGWKAADILASVHTPESANRLCNTLGIAAYTDNLRVMQAADRLFLAVKPAQMPEILAQLASAQLAPKPLISMALGWTVEKIQRVLPGWPVVRIMPNTPLALGEGVTLFEFSSQVSAQDRQEIRALFNCMGKTFEIPPALFDIATALSGSGPAFVYDFIDALASAAQAQGMEEGTARQLAVQTVLGAAKMVGKEDVSPAQLARKVATPGGCTAAGMEVLISSDFKEVVRETLAATARKAQQVAAD